VTKIYIQTILKSWIMTFYFRLHNLVTSRQQDKQNISILEKKMNEERKMRAGIELQLTTERKAKKVDEAAAARAIAMASTQR